MPTRSSKEQDFTTVAKRVVEQAIGKQWDGSPLLNKDAGKNPAAVALGKLGGAKGGKARAASLSPDRRREIAQVPHRFGGRRMKKSDISERFANLLAFVKGLEPRRGSKIWCLIHPEASSDIENHSGC